MSHTGKTNPFEVKLRDGDLHWVEEHDHTRGGCDMPNLSDPNAFVWRRGQRCFRNFSYTGTNVCACWQCSGLWHETKQQRQKRDRAKTKRVTRSWEDEYHDGSIEDEDCQRCDAPLGVELANMFGLCVDCMIELDI